MSAMKYDRKAFAEKHRGIPRSTYLGERQGYTCDESVHFIECGVCGGIIDCRDLGMVFDHEGPMPHPAQDQRQ